MNNIENLRESLFETIDLLKSGKIDIDKAKAISDIGQVIINSAKVENEFIKNNGGDGSGFIPIKVTAKNQIQRPPAEYSNNGHSKLLEQHS